VLWTAELGQGYSGFCAFGGRVWTQSQTLFGQYVVCLNAETGARIWQHRYDLPFEAAGIYPGPRATPTYYSGRVYFAGPNGLVGCLRARDGGRLWSVNVNERFGGRGTGFGYSCSPLVEDDKVILAVGGEAASVVALDATTGGTTWASGSEPASYCSAVPITVADRRLVIAYLQNALAIYDLRTGECVWQQRYSQGYNEHAALPLYEAPYLFVSAPGMQHLPSFTLAVSGCEATGGLVPQQIRTQHILRSWPDEHHALATVVLGLVRFWSICPHVG
jgi:outer membrane protein assembly factor BamB